MTAFRNAFLCRTLRLCCKQLQPGVPWQGVRCLLALGALAARSWGWVSQQPQVGARRAACGAGELPGASDSRDLSSAAGWTQTLLTDNVSSGSCSAAEAFHWEMQQQKSMLLDSKWLWNSCTGAAK